MYLLSGCEPDGRRDAARAARRTGRLGRHRRVARPTAAAVIRCTCIPTTPAAPSRPRWRSAPRAGSRSPRSPGARTHAPGGWSRERAVLAVVDGDGAAELFAGEGAHVLRPDPDATDPTSASAPSSCCAPSSTPAPRRSWCCPTGSSPPRNWSRGAPPRSAGASTWCRCRPGRWCRGWPRWPCTTPTGRPSTTATPWPAPPRARGTARCGVATEEALTWAGTCQPGDGLGIAGDEVLIVGEDITAAGAGLIDLLLVRGRRAGHRADRSRRGSRVSARRFRSTCTISTSAPSW